MLSACHPEIELHLIGPVEEPVEYKGHEGVREMLRDMAASWASFEMIGDDFREVGGRIVVIGRQRNVGRARGVTVGTPRGWLIDLLDGKAVAFHAFSSPREALEAAGLRDAAPVWALYATLFPASKLKNTGSDHSRLTRRGTGDSWRHPTR